MVRHAPTGASTTAQLTLQVVDGGSINVMSIATKGAKNERQIPAVLTGDVALVQDKEIMSANVGDEVVVLGVKAGCYFRFNQVGSEIWHLLIHPCRIDRVCHLLSQRYVVDEALLFGQVAPFLQTLIQNGLLNVVDGTGRD